MLCLGTIHGDGIRILHLNSESRQIGRLARYNGDKSRVEATGRLASGVGVAGGDDVVLVKEGELDGVAQVGLDACRGEDQLLVAAHVDVDSGGEGEGGVGQEGGEGVLHVGGGDRTM